MMRFIALFFLATLCAAPVCVRAQADTAQRDTVYSARHAAEQANLPPSTNLAIFAQFGYRTSGCDDADFGGILFAAGAMLKGDVYTPASKRWSLFLRADGAIGTLSSFGAGAGLFYSHRFYFSASYAYLQSPQCVAHNFATSVEKSVSDCMMFAMGYGRHGFLVEFDVYVFFSEERYGDWSYVGNRIETAQTPTAWSVRIGYSF